MKKVFLFLLAATSLMSCGSDDGEGETKRPSMVSIQGGNESYLFTMTYDTKGRLGTLTSTASGAHSFTFSYNEDDKVTAVASSGTVTDPILFTYSPDGKLATVTKGNSPAMVATWVDDKTLTLDNMNIVLDSKGDLTVVDGIAFTRDSGKGAFAGVKGIDALTLLIVESPTFFFASKKPVKTFVGAGLAYIMTNTFSKGYLSTSSFQAQGVPFTINVTY